MILRPAQPPLRCHKPVCGRLPSQRLRPAFPITRLLWSTLDTRPTVATQVSSTWGMEKSCEPPRWHPGCQDRDGTAPPPACVSWRAAARWPSRSPSSAALRRSLQRARGGSCAEQRDKALKPLPPLSEEGALGHHQEAPFHPSGGLRCTRMRGEDSNILCDAPAARMYCAPFPGWLSKLQMRVPTGRAPSG